MRRTDHFFGKWVWFALWALISGAILFLLGRWCLDSTNPSAAMALPIPQRFLTGLGFLLWIPITIITLTLILTASRFLVSKLRWASSAFSLVYPDWYRE